MRKSQDLYVSTGVEEYIGVLGTHEYSVAAKKHAKYEYIDCTCTLDIETSNKEEDGFLYASQCNIDGENCQVRYIEDFIGLAERLTEEMGLCLERRLVFYIHNLGYEQWYMIQILGEQWGIDSALYTKPHKPLTIRFGNGIEFRDSLKLFQKSLAGATKGCKHAKLAGDLDYRMWRTPDTPLSPDEWNYCINDVQGLWEAIERLKKEHGYNQATIPLTNTGMVLDEVNRRIRADGKVFAAMKALALNKEQLALGYKCMAGGDTHGTRWRAGRVYNNCNSADLKSAHPSQMILKDFPAGEPLTMPANLPEGDLSMLIDNHMGWIGMVFVAGLQIRPECPDPTISVSKCEDVEGIHGTDNGRLLGADGALIYMDSNDFQRFREAYTYDEIIGVKIVAFHLAPLPETFRAAVLDFFKVKESAPDGPERVFAKICVNTIFGACAQKVIRDEYDITVGDDITAEKLSWEDNLAATSEDKARSRQLKKLPFLWGLWTASLSRLALWELIKSVGWERVIYWDTDSCKYEGAKAPQIDAYNRAVMDLCEAKDSVVVNRKGKQVYIGVAEDEYPDTDYGYRKFTFLHAKCYAAEAWEDGEYRIQTTIAGVGKSEGAAAMHGDVGNLRDGLYIPIAGGQKLAYHSRPVTERHDFARSTKTASYIVMTPRDYKVQGAASTIIEAIDLDIIAE